MATFLFIHGSYQGAWVWDKIKLLLEKENNDVHAITLPGHEKNTTITTPSLTDYTNTVINYIESHNLTNIILVGHSFGGVTTSLVAQKIPERINTIIFLAALVLDNNQSFFDTLPKERKKYYELTAQKNNGTLPPAKEYLRKFYLNECKEKMCTEHVLEKLTPQPVSVYQEKVSLKDFHNLSVPMFFIICKNDVGLSKGAIKTAKEILPSSCTFLELDADHEPMVSRPKELAELLLTCIKK